MDEPVGPIRKSSRTPVPKKSFDLVEEYDVRPTGHSIKSTPASDVATLSREQKKQPKAPALIKIGRKKTPKSKIDPSPVKEKDIPEPEPEPIPKTKIPKEKISSKKRKYSAIDNENVEKSTSKKTDESTAPLSPLKITLSTVSSKEPVIQNPEEDPIDESNDSIRSSPSKKKKKKKSKDSVVVKKTRNSTSESKLAEDGAFEPEKIIVASIDSDTAIPADKVINNVKTPKGLKIEQKQIINRTSTESDAFINSFNVAPEEKKTKKKATRHSKQPQTDVKSVPELEAVLSPTIDKNMSDINKKSDGKFTETKDNVTSTIEKEDAEKGLPRKLAEEKEPEKIEIISKKIEKSPSPQKKGKKTEKIPSTSQELNNDTKPESPLKIKIISNPENKRKDETMEVSINDVEALTGMQIPEGTEPTRLKMKKRKVYKRKHGERILVRIVTELYDESGKVINSTVEEVKSKNEQSKKLKQSGPKVKNVGKKNSSSKKSKKSNEHNVVNIPESIDDGDQSIVEELPSPSKKRSEGGGKEFKKMQTLTAYILYCRKHRKRVVQQHPTYDFAQISKKLGEMWNNTSDPEKEVYRLQLEVHKAKVHSALRKIKLKSTGFSDENDGSPDADIPSSLRLLKKRDAKEQVDIPVYSTTNLEPIDFASHLVLLGESLTMISSALFQQDQQTVHGSLSVLLDSCLCALAPLVFLTSSVPEINSLPEEMMANTLDSISYILPGV